MQDMDGDKMTIYEDESGQLSFAAEDENYYPVISDYGKIPNRFIEKYANIGYIASLSMALAIQNVSIRNHSAYEGTQEGLYYEKLYKASGTDWSDGMISCIPVRSFIKFYGLSTGGKTYQNIDKLFNGTLLKNQWQILYEDEDVFVSTSVLTGTMYDKRSGCLYMKFNKDLEPLLGNIQKDYAQISLKVLGRLKEDYITNLYQIFKKRLDAEQSRCRKYNFPLRDEIEIEFSLDHLLFLSGIYPVDLTVNDISMQKVVELLKIQDYKAAAEIMNKEKLIEKYSTDPTRTASVKDFSTFKRRFLDKLFRRINGFDMPKKLDKIGRVANHADGEAKKLFDDYAQLCREHFPTDIHFRYETVMSGLGGKVCGIIFYVSKANWSVKDHANEKCLNEQDDSLTMEQMRVLIFIDDMMKDRGLKEKDIRVIARKSGWNLDMVKCAYQAAEYEQPDDFLGFIMDELENIMSSADNDDNADKKEADLEKEKMIEETEALIAGIHLDEEVSRQEVISILKESNWDPEKVKKAVKVAEKSNFNGFVGFVISAIRKSYELPKSKKTEKKTNMMLEFSQRSYSKDDFDELEKRKLKRIYSE